MLRTLFRLCPLAHQFGLGDVVVLRTRQSLRIGLSERSEPVCCIRVPMGCCLFIPLLGGGKIFGTTDADLGIVAHGKLGTRQTLACRLLRKSKRESFILLEASLGTAEEPLAEGHVGFNLALLAGERVVLDTKEGIEGERLLGELVRMAELVLGWGEVEVGSALDVLDRKSVV